MVVNFRETQREAKRRLGWYLLNQDSPADVSDAVGIAWIAQCHRLGHQLFSELGESPAPPAEI